jgi:hypothetical protein
LEADVTCVSTSRIDLDDWFGTAVHPWNPGAKAPGTWSLGAREPVDRRRGNDFSGVIASGWHTSRGRTDR